MCALLRMIFCTVTLTVVKLNAGLAKNVMSISASIDVCNREQARVNNFTRVYLLCL